jgi:ribonuclease HII
MPLSPLGACGLDEVGRGALAGPLVAAAVVLPAGFDHPLLRDSKLLSARQRETVEPIIRSEALALEVVAIEVTVIDLRGVGWANRLAFEQLIGSIAAPLYLVDGNLVLSTERSYRSVIGGDRLVPAISAASIVAKVFRDQLMRELHPGFPQYGWEQNKGYGTPAHLSALSRHGPCPHHRTSFIHGEQQELFAAGPVGRN